MKQIEDRVSHIYPPDRDWHKRVYPRGDAGGGEFSDASTQISVDIQTVDIQKMEQRVESLLHQPEFIVSMDTGSADDPLIIEGLWHKALKKKLIVFPNALFMGGVPEMTWLAVFQRPLSPPDFIHLWCAHKNEKVL